MLYLIGIGLGDENSISLASLDAIKKCDFVYLENYTSLIGFDIKELEKLTGNKVILAGRDFVESKDDILNNSKNFNTAFLVKGDVFSATTHIDLFLRAKNNKIKCKIFHNASIISAVSDTGLSLYKFGKVASIPFINNSIDSPYDIFISNRDMHTLFLLDLNPSENKYMNFKEAFDYLIKKSSEKKDNLINLQKKCIICCAIGTDNSVIKYGEIEKLIKLEIYIYPQCVIVPGELHFMEEDILNFFKL